MTTKSDKIAALKLEYPTLKSGSDEIGYTDLSASDYESTIESWAESLLAEEAETDKRLAEAETDKLTKETAQAKLAALGLTVDDLKALGLGNN